MNYIADHPALPPLANDIPAAGVAQGTPLALNDVANASRQKLHRLVLRAIGGANNADVAAASIREQQLISEHAGAGAAGAPAWAQALGAQIQAQGVQIQAQGVQLQAQIQAQGVQLQAQIQAQGVQHQAQIAQFNTQLARIANSSAMRDADVLQPVPNAAHQLPNIWYPATLHELRTCTAPRATALLLFYNIAPAAIGGNAQHRRCLAIAAHIGVRADMDCDARP
jgi:hypothetical protein